MNLSLELSCTRRVARIRSRRVRSYAVGMAARNRKPKPESSAQLDATDRMVAPDEPAGRMLADRPAITPFTDLLYAWLAENTLEAAVIQGNGEPHHPVRMRAVYEDLERGEQIPIELTAMVRPQRG